MDDLYQQIILEHSRNSKNWGSLGADAEQITINNPLCGDEITLSIKRNGNKIEAIRFEGRGCLISRAAASMLSGELEGKEIESLKTLEADFQELLKSGGDEKLKERLGELALLEGVKKYPVRWRCALLAFEGLDRLIKGEGRKES